MVCRTHITRSGNSPCPQSFPFFDVFPSTQNFPVVESEAPVGDAAAAVGSEEAKV